MQPVLPVLPCGTPRPETPDAAPPASTKHPIARPGPILDSRVLLQGHGSVGIRHNGVVYRLQATRLGKLILTK